MRHTTSALSFPRARMRATTSLIAAGLLAAALAVPTSAAPPTHTGVIFCVNNGGGTTSVFLTSVTKKVLNQEKRALVGDAPLDCPKGSVRDETTKDA